MPPGDSLIQGARSIPLHALKPEPPTPLGRRVRLLDSPELIAHWRRTSPGVWHPSHGMTGIVVDAPPAGLIGSGLRVRWDCGRTSWLGSCAQLEYLD